MKRDYIVLLKPEKKLTTISTPAARRGLGARGRTLTTKGTKRPTTMAMRVERLESSKASAVEARNDVERVIPAMPMKLMKPLKVKTPAKPTAQNNTWGVEATLAHTSPLTGEGIKVAVLDTGIHKTHPA